MKVEGVENVSHPRIHVNANMLWLSTITLENVENHRSERSSEKGGSPNPGNPDKATAIRNHFHTGGDGGI